MTKRLRYSISLFAVVLLVLCSNVGYTQTTGLTIKGHVIESGSGMPLKQVFISVSSTGVSTETDSTGAYSIVVPDGKAELIVDLPGYNKRKVFVLNREVINISLVSDDYKSMDINYYNPISSPLLKDATYSVSNIRASEIDYSRSTSFDQNIQGRVAGLQVIQNSGIPGNRTWMNIRGINSLYCRTQPLLYIDGMIHDYDYTNLGLMEGFSLNPLDIIDIEDLTDVSVLKSGESYNGGTASNGVIYINTEQKSEASTILNVSAYSGISLVPKSLDVMSADEYRNYAQTLGVPAATLSQFKYNNNTDWQKQIFKSGFLNKAHLFIKGGDDIATYNISTGYLKQSSIYDNSNFSRFNLRINGKVNITDKFSVAPNAKLSLADTYIPNQGPSAYKNPIISAITKPALMGVYSRETNTGVELPFLDDVGNENVSNPVALVKNAQGTNRNYNFLSSVTVQYKFNSHFSISTLTGIDFNNTREAIFLPNLGVVQVDSAYNSPGDFASEYRSTQNHTTINYNNQSANGHSIEINGGLKYMENTYKNIQLVDLNTPSDDYKNVGAGTGKLTYLRTTTGIDRGILWLSYWGSFNYNYLNKYFVNTNFAYDGTSATSKTKRYSLYPSIGLAWRLSSESFLSQASWLEDLKLRASWSQSGNIFSSVYDYSKLYYIERRYTDVGGINREAIPNDDLEVEKNTTINVGLDLSMFNQVTNIHLDYYKINIDNLIINQKLPIYYGYTNYFDNGGKLQNSGIEVALDQRFTINELEMTLGLSAAKQTNEIKELSFIDKDNQKNIVTNVNGIEYVTSVGNVANAFYGYKTDGIFNDAAAAANTIGPNGIPMQLGDVKYVDVNGDNRINNADKQIIGKPTPDLFGGITALFKYKRIQLSALFTYAMGNDAFNYLKYSTESMSTYASQSKNVLKRWTSSAPSTTMPRASLGDPTGNNAFSDRWIEDASYIRFKQLTVNYSIPGNKYYKGITLFATATNLFTSTKYTGYDPESVYMSTPFGMGLDYGNIPQTMSFILGLKLGL